MWKTADTPVKGFERDILVYYIAVKTPYVEYLCEDYAVVFSGHIGHTDTLPDGRKGCWAKLPLSDSEVFVEQWNDFGSAFKNLAKNSS